MNFTAFYSQMGDGFRKARARKIINDLMNCKTKKDIHLIEINNIFLIDEMDLCKNVEDAYKRVAVIEKEKAESFKNLLN